MGFKIGVKTISAKEMPKDLAFLTSAAAEAISEDLDSIQVLTGTPDLLEEFDEDEPDDPGHAANRKALAEVLGMVTFVVEACEDNGTLYGYWHGPEKTPIAEAPIVSYDSEGTISLESGKTLVDVLVCNASYENQARFDRVKAVLEANDIPLHATAWNKPSKSKQPPTDPEKLHDELFEKYKKAKKKG